MDINGEASEKQIPEDDVGFVIIRKKGQHPVHQMRGFLVSGEVKGYQGLEWLIVIQRVERGEMLTENAVRVSGRRGTDQIQDL